MPEQSRRSVNHDVEQKAIREAFDHLIERIRHDYPDELERCFTILLDLTGRRTKHERWKNWMLKRIENAPYLTPGRVAAEARFYFRMPIELMPWLIRMARTTKSRVQMRTFRKRLKADIALAHQEERERGEVGER